MQIVIADNGEVVATQEMIEEAERADFLAQVVKLDPIALGRVARNGGPVDVWFLPANGDPAVLLPALTA